jgi:DNA invertase Pin-like site-specific DNA recombinase
MVKVGRDIVAYLRTSTGDQKLGIDAQEETVKRIARERSCEIVRWFIEHESGGNNERLELDKTIRHARRVGALLVVAKLDRLARDSSFLMRLYDGDVPLLFGDLPEIDGSAASRLMVQMMANIAEYERRRIGERTREALAQLKAKGVTLGTPRNLTTEGRLKGTRRAAQARTAQALEEMTDVAAIATEMRRQGATMQDVADRLNAEGFVTRKGAAWNRVQIKRVLDRLILSPKQ